jgi:hypothetical protein
VILNVLPPEGWQELHPEYIFKTLCLVMNGLRCDLVIFEDQGDDLRCSG